MNKEISERGPGRAEAAGLIHADGRFQKKIEMHTQRKLITAWLAAHISGIVTCAQARARGMM